MVTEYVLLPSLPARKAITTDKLDREQNWVERLLEPVTKYILYKYPWNDYKLEKLESTLSTVGNKKGARRYTAEALAQAAAITLFAIPLAFISPILSVLPPVAAFVGYSREMKAPEKALKVKRAKIEKELPKFASTISHSLHTTRDVVKILSSYRKVCGDELREEIDITLADMKSGNYEAALRNLEGRIGSTKLSELVRGLLSVIRGEDQTVYFSIKNEELRKEYIEIKKREISMRPGKLKIIIIPTVVLILVLFVYIFGSQIAGNMGKLF